MLTEKINALRQRLQSGEAPVNSMRFFLDQIAPELTRKYEGEVIDDAQTRASIAKACAGLVGEAPQPLLYSLQLRVRIFQLQHGVFGIKPGVGSYCFFEDLQLGALMLMTNRYGVWFAHLE